MTAGTLQVHSLSSEECFNAVCDVSWLRSHYSTTICHSKGVCVMSLAAELVVGCVSLVGHLHCSLSNQPRRSEIASHSLDTCIFSNNNVRISNPSTLVVSRGPYLFRSPPARSNSCRVTSRCRLSSEESVWMLFATHPGCGVVSSVGHVYCGLCSYY